MRAVDLVHAALRPLGLFVGRLPRAHTLDHHLKRILDQLDINLVLDVGAHWGEYATRLRQLGYPGRIVSFEPVEDSFRRLEKAAARDPHWLVKRLALGEAEGTAIMNVAAGTDLASMLTPSRYAGERFGDRVAAQYQESVAMARLGSVLPECTTGIAEPRILLKLDTQGYDLPILSGAVDVLDRILALQTELAVKPIYEGIPSLPAALKTLESLNFELTGFFPVCRDRDGLRLVEVDSVFRRIPTNLPAG